MRADRESPRGGHRVAAALWTRLLTLALSLLVWLWPSPGASQRSGPVPIHRAQPSPPPGWSSTGPDGVTPTVLAIDPSRPTDVYVGSVDGGIFKSADKGASWSMLRKPVPFESILALAIQPSTGALLAGTSDGVSLSLDGGLTWTDPSLIPWTGPNPFLLRVYTSGLVFHPTQPCVAFAATNFNVFRSADCGVTWHSLSGSPFSMDSLVFDPSDPRVIYAVGEGGIFRSLDGGSNWTNRATANFHFARSLVVDPANPSTLYSADLYGYGYRILKSTDRGTSWAAVFHGTSDQAIGGIVIGSSSQTSVLYATTFSGGVLRSFDGRTWDSPNVGLPGLSNLFADTNYRPPVVPAVDPEDPMTVYVGSLSGGLFKSVDGGGSWKLSRRGLVNSEVLSIATDPSSADTVYAAASVSGLFKTINAGENWKQLEEGGLTDRLINAVAVDPSNARVVFAGTGEGHVFKSEDAGETWTNISAGLPNIPGLGISQLLVDPAQSETVFASMTSEQGLGPGLFKSTDGGATWNLSQVGMGRGQPPGYKEVRFLTSAPDSGMFLYALAGGELFTSKDGGLNWQLLVKLPTVFGEVAFVEAVAVDPTSPDIAYLTIDLGSPRVWKTIDRGQNWFPPGANAGVNTQYGLPNTSPVRSLAVDFLNPQILYAATDRNGVFRSINGGVTWSPFDIGTGAQGQMINCLAIHPGGSDRIYAGTHGGGVLHLPVSGLFPVPSR